MAIRVQTQDDLIFGVMRAEVRVTHARFQKSGMAPVVRALNAPVTVAAGRQLRIPSGVMDVVYPAGQSNNVHMMAVVGPYWSGESIEVDVMTDNVAVVTDAGYSQQVYSNWSLTQEPD